MEIITGNLLGDGSLRYSNFKRDGKIRGNARYEMTMSAKVYPYLLHLREDVYKEYTTESRKLCPYPNTTLAQHYGKEITQYYFSSRHHPLFTILHKIWYKYDDVLKKHVKIVPIELKGFLGVRSLA